VHDPVWWIDLLITFGTPVFKIETLTFKVVGSWRTYHSILVKPCYAKFMVVPKYTYLNLKMSGPAGTITVGTTVHHAHECEVECYDLAKGIAFALELSAELQIVDE
jgi:hypothetical protein